MDIGLRIRQLREGKNLSQKDLGEVLGVGPNQIGHFEHNRSELSVSQLLKLNEYFETDLLGHNNIVLDKKTSANELEFNGQTVRQYSREELLSIITDLALKLAEKKERIEELVSELKAIQSDNQNQV